MNDCLLNETLTLLYDTDSLHLKLAPAILTTSELRLLLGKGIVTDFGADMPCQLGVNITGMPNWTKNYNTSYTDDGYFRLVAPISLDIKCVNSNTEGDEFEQVTTLILNLDTSFGLSVKYGMTVHFDIYELNVEYVEDTDTTVKLQSTRLIKYEI